MANPFGRSPIHDAWRWLVAIGVLALIGGALAFVHPFAASMTVVAMAGLVFIILGVVKGIYAARIRSDRAYVVALILAALFILMGFGIWVHPLTGLVSLTAMVAALFLAMGLFKLSLALHLRPADGWGWLALSGAVSLALGAAIFANFPVAATAVLGLLLGVELLSTGVFFVLAGLFLSRF